MMIQVLLTAILTLCGTWSFANTNANESGSAPAKQTPTRKVLLITLVNAKYEEAIKQPYLSQLAKEGALLTNYHGVSHPSKPNFIALVAGDTFKITNDHAVKLDAKNLADLVEEKGQTWKVYAEDFPGNCSTKGMAKLYKEKMNPLLSFKNIQENPERCKNIVNANVFEADFKNQALPSFAMYIPHQLHNGHDSDTQEASKWLGKFLAPLLKEEKFKEDTLVIVLFDQDYYYTPKNHVYAVLWGKDVKPAAKSGELLNHYNMLRTIESYLGLETLEKNDAKAKPISGIWQNENVDVAL